MKPAALAVLIGLAALSLVDAKQYSTFRVHAEANPSNGPVFSTPAEILGTPVTVEKVPTLSENDVTGLKIYRTPDGTRGALFQLNEHGRPGTGFLERRPARRHSLRFHQWPRRSRNFKSTGAFPTGIYIASGLTSGDIELLKKDWPPRVRK